jgi:hypothetical protein
MNTLLAGAAAWAAEITPAQWLAIGLIVLFAGGLIISLFEDYWLAVEKAFEGHGVGHDDMADVHQRTWPEYWQ